MNPENFRHESNLGLRGFFILVLIELKAFWKNRDTFYTKLLTPIFYFLFLAMGIGGSINKFTFHGLDVSYIQFTSIGILGTLIISQMSQTVYRTVIDKRWGLLPLKFFNGVRPFYYVAGMSTFPFISVIIQSIIIYLCSIFVGDYISIDRFILVLISLSICLLFWTSIGLIISILVNNYQQRDMILGLSMLPITFTAPTFYSLENAPLYLKIISYFNPLTYQLETLRSIAFGNINYIFIGITLLVTIIIYFLAVFLINRASLVSKEV